MKKKRLTPEEKLEKYNRLSKKKDAIQRRLKYSESRKAPARVARLFRLPFGKEAFEAMWEAIIFLYCTILLAGVGSLVGLGIVLAAIADVLWTLIFWPLYPVILLACLIAHPLHVVAWNRSLKKVQQEISALNIGRVRKQLQEKKEKEERERAARRTTSPSVSISSGVTETDYYKRKVEEEYRRLMNLPPIDDSLPSYATDTSLDLHPGDY